MVIAELFPTLRQLPRSDKLEVMRFLLAELAKEEKMSALQSTIQASATEYPLRGLPLMVAEDFDEPMPELWNALSQ